MRHWLDKIVSVIQRPATPDDYGTLGGGETTVLSDVPARIVPASVMEQVRFQALGMKAKYVIYMLPQQGASITQGMIVRHGDRDFHVSAIDNPDEAGAYIRLYCEG